MKITAQLALSQMKVNKKRTIAGIFAIALATSLITTVMCFVTSANKMLTDFLGLDYGEYGGAYSLMLAIPALIFEHPQLSAFKGAWGSILYAGVMSCGVAYTLQIVGQKNMNPTVASLILSLESCISVIAGWLIRGQNLSSREIFGCVLMFGAIILAQLPQKGTAF